MSSYGVFSKNFEINNLKRIYKDIVSLSPSIGVDNMSHEVFWKYQANEIEIIKRKCLSGDYKFNKYKLKLISKGRGKFPREISIPTIRDKIALRSICDSLQEIYQNVISFDLPQDMVINVKKSIENRKYDYFIKFDVANFYPSIQHDKLISRLGSKIRDRRILALIESAISSPTVSKPRHDDKPSLQGVPQGLSISNILAAIYLLNIDVYFRSNKDIEYYRYVDDIMILCNSTDAISIADDLIS
ncbi:reverse transcriptase domain-containing protein [Morganella sp. GD04133]|uniref:reverse transcriptase domain-containing protein n=1 Tax=Morganella sp. GD04133 TaxID=2975435 RepID=UPI002448ADE6|nr:reverse transcriptase domain-containing protein [Morganella sp. GD04133]MDH0356351.1 reverse transcriptase domain-containing protein [Morganella sp. GD04133]